MRDVSSASMDPAFEPHSRRIFESEKSIPMIKAARALVFLGVLAIPCTGQAPAAQSAPPERDTARKPEIPELKIEQFRLPNGLRVILHEDHKTASAALYVYYLVGSKDEQPGRTGLAHLFEHLMFEGSEHSHDRHANVLANFGGDPNAMTSEDRTIYYETFPSNGLETVLWLEADRMEFLLPAITQEELNNERDIIRNEQFERTDNVPYGRADEVMRQEAYPAGHAYRHSIGGSMTDLGAVTVPDLDVFYQKFYAPNNAILCLAGDFKTAEAKRLITKYFSFDPVGRGKGRKAPKANPVILSEAKHITLKDRVSLPRIQLYWESVPANHPDEAPLDVLAAVLDGTASEDRLYRELVLDRPIARQIYVSHPTKDLSGSFQIWAYVLPGQNLDEVVALIDREVERLQRAGPDAAEVKRAQVAREVELIASLESISSKAGLLAGSAASLGDPLAYRKALEMVFAVTTADVKRVANRYLGSKRIRLDVIPGEPAARPPEVVQGAAKNDPLPPPPDEEVVDSLDRSIVPKVGPTPAPKAPRFEGRTLKNGLKLMVIERHDVPIATFNLTIKSGEGCAPLRKEGLGSLALGLLTAGTRSRTQAQLTREAADYGASLHASCGPDSSNVRLTVLSRKLREGLNLFADVVLEPAFPEKALAKNKRDQLTDLAALLDHADDIASIVLKKLIYGPNHPYGRPIQGTISSVKSITRDDVVSFYQKSFVPGNAVLIVVGDVRVDAIQAELEARFGRWASGTAPAVPAAHAQVPVANQPLYLIDRPGAAQSVVMIGWPAVAWTSPDGYPFMVLDQIVGAPGGRIDTNLREDKGYTYGITSSFDSRRSAGLFHAGGAVHARVTKESLEEIVNELTKIVGQEPPNAYEVQGAKEPIIQGAFEEFETSAAISNRLAFLTSLGLPDDEYQQFQGRVRAVTSADVVGVARKYLNPALMTILVVGDRSQIERSLRTLPFVKSIRLLDVQGNLAADPSKPRAGAGRPAAKAARPY
jgi:zinc protease